MILSSAMHSLDWWKQMAWWFFLSWDSENEGFLYTDSLSQKTVTNPSIGTSIILNLYLNEINKSVAIHNATTLPPKVEPLTVFWLF